MKKILTFSLALLIFTATPAQAYIPWDKIEEHILATEYDWLEDSERVWLLQYWMGIDQDGVYGRNTHKWHRQWAMERSIPVRLYSTVSPNARFSPAVEQWRSTVEAAIVEMGGDLRDTARFLSIISCESGGDPEARSSVSTASGLMQHLRTYWDARSRTALGYVGDIYNGQDNIRVSSWLIYRATGGGWQHWVCS